MPRREKESGWRNRRKISRNFLRTLVFSATDVILLQKQEIGRMKFRMVHNNFNVLDLDRSLKFYREAFDMQEVRRINAEDGSFIIVYLEDGASSHQLELTWLRDRKEPYNLGDNEFHLAFKVDDYEAAHARHEKMGCICYENPAMGIYFVEDPDSYWLEVIPEKF